MYSIIRAQLVTDPIKPMRKLRIIGTSRIPFNQRIEELESRSSDHHTLMDKCSICKDRGMERSHRSGRDT